MTSQDEKDTIRLSRHTETAPETRFAPSVPHSPDTTVHSPDPANQRKRVRQTLDRLPPVPIPLAPGKGGAAGNELVELFILG